MTNRMLIRQEVPADAGAIRVVNEAAFGTLLEADIIEALRRKRIDLVSLVAESDGSIVGHILFSPVSLDGRSDVSLMGLGPMSVLPGHQRQGVGSALVLAGLDECRKRGCSAVVVLGHPAYYPRFGFVPASRCGISCAYDVPEDTFMLIELRRGSLRHVKGRVLYDQAFGGA